MGLQSTVVDIGPKSDVVYRSRDDRGNKSLLTDPRQGWRQI